MLQKITDSMKRLLDWISYEWFQVGGKTIARRKCTVLEDVPDTCRKIHYSAKHTK